MDNSLIYQVQLLLSYHKIPFDKEELAFQIQSHPSYPSLHAITGVLDHFKIDNLALDIPATQEVIDQLPKTFIGQIQTDEGDGFAVVVNNGDKIEVITDTKNKKTYSPAVFLRNFTGIIVAVEKTKATSEIRNSTPLKSTVLILVFLGVIASLITISRPSIAPLVYLLLSIVGVFVSSAIIKQQLGFQTDIGEAFCSHTDVTKDCNSVLSSSGAIILKIFKLSDISLIYFSSLTLSTVAFIVLSYEPFFLFGISLLAIPIIIYSIYYQYAFAKAWCPLCLIIASVLSLQTAIAIFYFSEIFYMQLEIKAVLVCVLFIIVITGLWNYLSPKVEVFQDLKKSKIAYFKFKRNFDLFKSVLYKSPQIETAIPVTSEIILGDKNAALSIVIVTSPFCGHCKPVHFLVEDILKLKKNQVAITIRFNVATTNEEGDLFKIASRLTEIFNEKGSKKCMQAMHDIYSGMSVQKWLLGWGECKNTFIYRDVLKIQNEWCTSHNINFTPEILVDGRSFPKEYDRKDLALFIENLSESCRISCPEEILETY